MTITQKRETCIHEAGHVVMALLLNLPVIGVHIRFTDLDSTSFSLGTIEFNKYNKSYAPIEEMEARVMVYASGLAAECVLLQNKRRWLMTGEIRDCLSILMDIYYWTTRYQNSSRNEQNNFIIAEFRKRKKSVETCFVDPYIRRLISSIASELYRKGGLTPADIRLLRRQLIYRNLKHLRPRIAALKRIWETEDIWDYSSTCE